MRKRTLAMLIASLAVAGTTAVAFAQQRPDMSPNDRPEFEAQERELEARENRNEATFTLPRNAAGEVDFGALLDDVQSAIARGAREIRFRGANFTPGEIQGLLLNTDAGDNLLARIAAVLPNDGLEHQVRLRGSADIRVVRQPDGTLRARIEHADFGGLSAAERTQLAQRLAADFGFDRLRLRGVDAAGNRVRIEVREGVLVERNESPNAGPRSASRDAGPGNDRGDDRRGDRRVERVGRAAQADRGDRPGRVERAERADRVERAERLERPDRVARVDRVERVERVDRVERLDRPDRSGRR